MAGNFPIGTPALNVVGNVVNPAVSAQPDGAAATLGFGRHNEILMSRIHGEGYISRARGNGFCASFLAGAGATIIAAGQTTGHAVLYNPVGSGVLVDLERIHIAGATVETDVISGLALEGSFQTPSGTLTSATVTSFPLGGARGAPLAKAYTVPTIVAMTYICNIGLTVQATTSPMSPGIADLGGKIVLAPGFSINLISNITQGANLLCVDYFWSEWPI